MRPLDRRILVLILAIALVLATQAIQTQKVLAQPTFYVASLDGGIDAGAQDFVTTSIDDAKATHATTFILVINTFGGNANNMDRIINAVSSYQSEGNIFITLVAPKNAHAFSAGAFIAEASTRIYMLPGTVIGSATPVLPPLSDPTTLQKDINAFATFMNSTTRSFGRNGNATARMVTDGVSYDDTEATRLNVVNATIPASSVRDALGLLPGPDKVPDANTIEIHTPGVRSLFLSVLADPNLSGVLFLLGVFAILADLYHPTFILSIIGATALALALVGLGVFGASIVSIILMLIGALFIFLEIKTHHGLSALVGVVIFIIGFLLIFRLPPPAPSPNQPTGNLYPVGFLTYVILAFIGGGIVLGSLYLYRVRETLLKRPPYIDPKAIIGKEGYLTTDVKAGDFGTANIGAEDWTVTSSQDLSKGTRIKVKDVQGLRLVVDKEE